MIGPIAPSAAFLTTADYATTPTLPAVTLVDSTGATAIARSTTGIIHLGDNTYGKTLTAPSAAGYYQPLWDDNGGTKFPDEVVYVSNTAVAVVAQTSTVITSTPSEFWIKQHDTREPLTFQVVEDDGTVVNLTDATESRFLMRLAGAASPKVNNASHVTITAPLLGTGIYQWQTGDTDTVNTYSGEIQFTFSDGRLLTAPTRTYLTIHVVADLGP